MFSRWFLLFVISYFFNCCVCLLLGLFVIVFVSVLVRSVLLRRRYNRFGEELRKVFSLLKVM